VQRADSEGPPVVTAQKRKARGRGPSNINYTDNLQELRGGLVVLAALAQVALGVEGLRAGGCGGKGPRQADACSTLGACTATAAAPKARAPAGRGQQRHGGPAPRQTTPAASAAHCAREPTHARTTLPEGPQSRTLGISCALNSSSSMVWAHAGGRGQGGQPCRQASRGTQSAARRGRVRPGG